MQHTGCPRAVAVAPQHCKVRPYLLPPRRALISPVPLQGELVTPEPGFVIKATDVSDGRKVFINVCQSPLVDLPAPKTQLDAEGNEHQVCVTV